MSTRSSHRSNFWPTSGILATTSEPEPLVERDRVRVVAVDRGDHHVHVGVPCPAMSASSNRPPMP